MFSQKCTLNSIKENERQKSLKCKIVDTAVSELLMRLIMHTHSPANALLACPDLTGHRTKSILPKLPQPHFPE